MNTHLIFRMTFLVSGLLLLNGCKLEAAPSGGREILTQKTLITNQPISLAEHITAPPGWTVIKPRHGVSHFRPYQGKMISELEPINIQRSMASVQLR